MSLVPPDSLRTRNANAPRDIHCFHEEILCFELLDGAPASRHLECRPTTGGTVTPVPRDEMDYLTDDIRRRVLIEASLLTHEEWTTIVSSFYRRLLEHHPRLAVHFTGVNVAFQVQKLVVILTNIARDLPDRTGLDRVLFNLGLAHVHRGIERAEFTEFIALLANVLSGRANLASPDEAYAVWYQELSAVATAMLLTSP
jgi:hemoglobin-like flavoprotein